ncbi:MAG: hypothetical protein ACI4WZ_06410, partial [Eubacteriales bacterium]
RLWGKYGCPTPKESVLLRLRGGITEAELCDFEACAEVFGALKKRDRGYIIDAVRAVYLCEPEKTLGRMEISHRVTSFALTLPADERTVYRYLKIAREMFIRAKSCQSQR